MRNAPVNDFVDGLRNESRLDPWEKQEQQNRESLARQGETRQARQQAEDREEFVQQLSNVFGGDVAGAIFDLSTNTYTPKQNNQQGIDEDSNDRSIDSFGSTTNNGIEAFNGTVAICINGTPYYIDIAYDDNIGPYAIATGENYPITEP